MNIDNAAPIILAIAVVAIASLAGCAQLQTTATRIEPQLEAACAVARQVAEVASFVPAAATITPYVKMGCSTAEGLAKLAADPSSVEWVGQLVGKMKALTGQA